MKFSHCVFLALPACLPALADEQNIATGQSNCQVINPKPRAQETVSWSGPCSKGYADGEGHLQWFVDGKPSSHYDGSMHGGRPDGQGSYNYASGAAYLGEWKNGMREGKGEMTYADGWHYKGRFSNGEREGYGSITRKGDNASYTGEWKHGVQDGMGMQLDADGSSYEGQFKNGKRDGDGTRIFANQDRYAGQWKEGRQEGQGVMLFAAGNRYEGQFKGGNRDGGGTMTYPSGHSYEGQWSNGRPDGAGVMSFASGARYQGQWKQGAIEGAGVLLYPGAGRRVEGQFKAGRLTSYASTQDGSAPFGLKPGMFDGGAYLSSQLEGPVPFDKTYAELSAEQKNILKAPYGPMEQADEPPFPLHGLKAMMSALGLAQSRLYVEARVEIIVQVNSEGDASSAQVLGSLDPQMRQLLASVLMREKYKPALCNGRACAMNYLFVMQFKKG